MRPGVPKGAPGLIYLKKEGTNTEGPLRTGLSRELLSALPAAR